MMSSFNVCKPFERKWWSLLEHSNLIITAAVDINTILETTNLNNGEILTDKSRLSDRYCNYTYLQPNRY